ALIDVKGGDLVLTGVELTRDSSKKLRSLIRVEDGHLIVNHCRLIAINVAGATDVGGGNLIEFRALTTRQLPDRPWPFEHAPPPQDLLNPPLELPLGQLPPAPPEKPVDRP